MSKHTAEVHWKRAESKFTDNRYSRAHHWRFDGGANVPASSSPEVVRVPFSDPGGVDPEEALVAALSSCHMLFFLSFAAREGYVVDEYVDVAEGRMGKNAAGRNYVEQVTLNPQITFSGTKAPDEATIQRLHHESHEACYIANSVLTEIVVRGRWTHNAVPVSL